jgi:hypothetical protein
VTDKPKAAQLPIGQLAAKRLTREGDALSQAYKDFLNRLIRQQRIIDQIKLRCGVS